MRLFAVLAATLIAHASAIASPATALVDGTTDQHARDEVSAGVSATAWATAELGWMRRLDRDVWGRPVRIGAALELPVLLWGETRTVDTGRIAARAASDVLARGRFRVVVDGDLAIGVERSVMGTWIGIRGRLGVLPGVRLGRWFVALDLELNQALSTHVHHSAYVRDSFAGRHAPGTPGAIDGPRDGWIALPFRRWATGLAFAWTPAERWSLFGAAGLLFTERSFDAGLTDLMSVGDWPFFAEVGLARRL